MVLATCISWCLLWELKLFSQHLWILDIELPRIVIAFFKIVVGLGEG